MFCLLHIGPADVAPQCESNIRKEGEKQFFYTKTLFNCQSELMRCFGITKFINSSRFQNPLTLILNISELEFLPFPAYKQVYFHFANRSSFYAIKLNLRPYK